MSKKYQFKKDKYKSARGGYTRLLSLSCRECGTVFAKYQKDGPGNLRRLYMDRIMFPEKLVGLEDLSLSNISPLKCDKCMAVIGTPFIYKKENRKAFRVFQDAVLKKVVKL